MFIQKPPDQVTLPTELQITVEDGTHNYRTLEDRTHNLTTFKYRKDIYRLSYTEPFILPSEKKQQP